MCQGCQDLRRELESLLECDARDQRRVDVLMTRDENMSGGPVGLSALIASLDKR